eukprot:3196704-Rhodomonas_salina.1
MSVPEVMARSHLDDRLKQGRKRTKIGEVGGCVRNTPQTMTNELCMDLDDLLSTLSDDDACCAITMANHTIAVGHRQPHWWAFDSGKGTFSHSRKRQALQDECGWTKHETEAYSAVVFRAPATEKQ